MPLAWRQIGIGGGRLHPRQIVYKRTTYREDLPGRPRHILGMDYVDSATGKLHRDYYVALGNLTCEQIRVQFPIPSDCPGRISYRQIANGMPQLRENVCP